MASRHFGDTVTSRLPRFPKLPRLPNLAKSDSWAGRVWVLSVLSALTVLAHNPTLSPPSPFVGISQTSMGRNEGAGFFLAWHQPYGLPGVHVLKAGGGYSLSWARMLAHFEWEDWDGLWESRSATLGGALTWAGLSVGAEWVPRLEILSAGTGAQDPRLLTWDMSHFDLGVEWKHQRTQAMTWAVGSSYAPGQTRFWVQAESRLTGAGLLSSSVWSARLILQIPVGGWQPFGIAEPTESIEPIDPLAALRLTYAWSPGFSLVMSAEAPWSSGDADGTNFGRGSGASFSRNWQWSASLTLPWGLWRGQSAMQSKTGLPATLGAALGWGGWSGSDL